MIRTNRKDPLELSRKNRNSFIVCVCVLCILSHLWLDCSYNACLASILCLVKARGHRESGKQSNTKTQFPLKRF